MRNEYLKRTGQLRNVRVESGFVTVCIRSVISNTSTSVWQSSSSFTAVVRPTTPDPITQTLFLPPITPELSKNWLLCLVQKMSP